MTRLRPVMVAAAAASAGILACFVGAPVEAARGEPPCRLLKDGTELRGAITKSGTKLENGSRIEFYRMTFASPVCLPGLEDQKKTVRALRVHVVPESKLDQGRLEAAVKSGRAVSITGKQYIVGHTPHHMAPIVSLGSRVTD